MSYTSLLQKFPILTKSLSAGLLFVAGDLFAQGLQRHVHLRDKTLHVNEESRASQRWKYDYRRTLRMFLYGTIVIGPVLHFWYGALEAAFPGFAPGAVFRKALTDQIVAAPIMNGVFYVVLGAMEGRSWAHIETNLRAKYIDTMKTNYLIWPFVQLTNFGVVPPAYRVVYINTWGTAYNAYLSWMQHKKVQSS